MMVHELLRQAALILGAGWSKGCDARDITVFEIHPASRRHHGRDTDDTGAGSTSRSA